MADRNPTSNAVSLPGLVKVKATQVSPPPGWALLERQLMKLMEDAVRPMVEKYAEKGGAFYFADDVDDLYERVYNWGLFYAMGADKQVLDLALQSWNATTRFHADDIVSRFHPRFSQQIHNEYYNQEVPGASEWFHQGEGNMAFYHFGLADPTISENFRRAKRFAAMFMDEDPEAANYDPEHRVFRSPIQTSVGPYVHSSLEHATSWLQGGIPSIGEVYRWYGVRATLDPVVVDLEPDWTENPARRDEILKLFDQVVLNGDVANSLGATALVTNAYLYTGEEKYKQWVLDYTEAWMERMRRNGGIMPDNVGPTGQIGENRQGQWWGGLYGWNSFVGYGIMFSCLTIAAECAVLLSGDFSYLELLRSQIKVLMDNATLREDGHLTPPARYGPDGWSYHMGHPDPEKGRIQPFRLQEPTHLYHISMASEDYDLIARIREADKERDWNEVPVVGEKNCGDTELARFQYYDGKNPDWPEKALRADYQNVLNAVQMIQSETRDPFTLIADNPGSPNPVYTKALTQVMMGAPHSVYTGGLVRGTLRYFDSDRARPGLPLDVAALVDRLDADGAGVQLVNLNPGNTRNLIVQAGAFAEHQFVELTHEDRTVPVDSRYFAVQLPPGSSIRLDLGMRRFANQPTYAFPWHGDSIPVPYQ